MVLLIVLLVAGFIALMVSLFACLLLMTRGALARKEELAARAMAPEPVIYSTYKANFFGLASKGMGQLRGNGVLALTRLELAFFMLKPAREVRVPLERVRRIEDPKSWLGKSVARRLLAVYFLNEDGAEDAVALWVPDVAEWTARIKAVAPAPDDIDTGGRGDTSQ